MNHVISIGINNVIGLPPLTAAAQGAIDFDTWAQSQKYKTKLFTDTGGKQVSVNDVFLEIERIIDEKTCEKLIIFFAGHGILLSPFQERWLFPKAQKNPNESVNVVASIANAQLSDIPYIVFISDACRILPKELQLTGSGYEIFPIGDGNGDKCVIDTFYATLPGNVAKEVSSTVNSKGYGIFTKALLEILEGQHPESITGEIEEGVISYSDFINPGKKKKIIDTPSEWNIKCTQIETPLKNLIQEKISAINLSLEQPPGIKIIHQDIKPYISKFNNQEIENILKKTVTPCEIKEDILAPYENDDYPQNFQFEYLINKKNTSSIFRNSTIKKDDLFFNQLIKSGEQDYERIQTKSERHDYIRTGFVVIGKKIANVLAKNEQCQFIDDGDCTYIHIVDEELLSILLILPNGESIPVAIMKNYIGTLIFKNNRLLTVNYSPSKFDTRLYNKYLGKEKKIFLARDFVANAANEGFDYSKLFEKDFIDGKINYSVGSFLRIEKALDPSLGLYASYAYFQDNKLDQVNSVYTYMKKDNKSIFYDVSLLAGQLESDLNDLAPFCPMLSLGWAYRKRFEHLLLPEIKKASQNLIPNLWTTFNKNATIILEKLFNQNLIK
ncbi:caspase family protein [Chryseobacterium sp.]|uniref:caspase family protein n=1 Tax=Chryseobacterium sp. TaxID=1871047 RepID=UPI002FCA8E07